VIGKQVGLAQDDSITGPFSRRRAEAELPLEPSAQFDLGWPTNEINTLDIYIFLKFHHGKQKGRLGEFCWPEAENKLGVVAGTQEPA
jgi:hypothetical protein